jgi:hypothetical protein
MLTKHPDVISAFKVCIPSDLLQTTDDKTQEEAFKLIAETFSKLKRFDTAEMYMQQAESHGSIDIECRGQFRHTIQVQGDLEKRLKQNRAIDGGAKRTILQSRDAISELKALTLANDDDDDNDDVEISDAHNSRSTKSGLDGLRVGNITNVTDRALATAYSSKEDTSSKLSTTDADNGAEGGFDHVEIESTARISEEQLQDHRAFSLQTLSRMYTRSFLAHVSKTGI